jgi:hypothetical protein
LLLLAPFDGDDAYLQYFDLVLQLLVPPHRTATAMTATRARNSIIILSESEQREGEHHR